MSKQVIYKIGVQSADDPMEFIMSSDSKDRHGDIVEQDWKLAQFKQNPIALFGHEHSFPIGTWKNVRREGRHLIGKLQIAAENTSERINEIRSLVEQRILRAVSVGFIPGEVVPLDEKAPWDGYRLSKNSLLECSLVSVPANPDAIARSFDQPLTALQRDILRDATVTCVGGVCKQLEPSSRDSDAKPKQSTFKSNTRTDTMSLSEKIRAKQAKITELKNQLSAISETGIDDEGNIEEETAVQITELKDQIDSNENSLEIMLNAEAGLAMKARAATGANPVSQPNVHVQINSNKPKGHRAMAALACLVKAHQSKTDPALIAKQSFKDEPEIEMITRAASNPADTTTPAWAAPLVRDTWGEFIELIRDMSVYPRAPGLRMEFDRYGKINMPVQGGRGGLAGDWIGEGAPIPVKEGSFTNKDMQPKKLGVISTFTKEISMHSIPAIQSMITDQILGDTAEALDTFFMDAVARSATRPAGLQDATETVAANIVASAGATNANIDTDIKGILGRVMAARAGTGGAWIMNPLRALGLEMIMNAANGAYPYRSSIQAGVLAGYPIIMSDNVPAAVVAFIGGRSMTYGNDYAPMIDVSDQATLHMEDTVAGVKPIVDGTGAGAQPVRSLFQTDTMAVKMTLGLDWRIVRPGGVQVLTGVAW